MAELLAALNHYPAVLALLRQQGHRLMVCDHDIDEILDKLGQGRVEIVCIASQADYDGWQLLRMIRSGRFCRPDLPVIMLGEAQWHAHEIQFAAELSCWLVYNGDDIGAVVERCLGDLARSKPSVLVIEDDVETAQLSYTALNTQAEVELAYDGASGLRAWLQRRHDLLLLDVQLPELSGAEVLQAIRTLNPQQPIIILTADTTTARYRALMSAGATDYLTKPINVAALRACCRSVLHYSAFRNQRDFHQGLLHQQRLAARRLRAADDSLSCGQTQSASWHVKHAMATLPDEELSDDDNAEFFS